MRILEGIRVVDWSVLQVGPYCAAMLADMGADVIHVEEPGSGDMLRGLKSLFGVSLIAPQGRHWLFEDHNRNKRGLAVDLSTDKGREIMYRLIDTADVFLTNYRPQAVSKLGFDYEVLSARNPRLIYAQATGFGMKGPDAQSPSIDIIAQARSGLMLASGEEGGPPAFLASGIGDRVTAFAVAYGIGFALLARERFGIGQKLEVSQLATMILAQGTSLMRTLAVGEQVPRHSHKKPPRNPLYNYYRCKDGRYLVFACWQERYWTTFCTGIGRTDLEHDPLFADMDSRARNGERLVEILDEVFLTKTGEEWNRDLRAAGDLLFTVVNGPADLASDPQVIANDFLIEWDHPVLGSSKWPGFLVQFSKTPLELRAPAPELGEHTEEILLELGYDWEQIAQLRDENII